MANATTKHTSKQTSSPKEPREAQPEDWQRRWSAETSCSPKELAQLCCGWNPDASVLPDPALCNRVMETILRAVRVGDLKPIDLRIPGSREEFFYGDLPLFRLSDAAVWAKARYPSFPLEISVPPAAELRPVDELMHDERREAFARNIDRRRQDNGWTVEQLADKVALDPSTVKDHVAAKSLPHVGNQKKYAEAFGVNVSDLFE